MTPSTSDGSPPPDAPGESRATAAFETAQQDLFEAAGLDVQSQFVDLDGPRARTHVFEAGPPDDDPPLVFVHGTAGFGAFLAPLVAQFDDARRIAFDRPGYGLSDPFEYATESVRRTLVDAVEGVLDATAVERADLVCHSMGGYAGVLFALARPERVRSLVLVGSVPAFPGTQPPVPLRLLTVPLLGRLLQRLQKSGEEGVLDVAEVFGEREAIQDHPALVRALAAHEADPKSSAAGRSEFAALLSVRGWRPSMRLGEDELGRLRAPTSVVWGENDPLGRPGDVRAGVDSIPDARFETVDAGHMPFLGHPGRCAQVVREAREARPAGDG